MKVLILGGDGYLGWPTTMHFANEGHDVYAIDNLSKRKIESEYGVEPLNIIKPFNERVKAWNLNQKNKIKHYVSDLLNYKVLGDERYLEKVSKKKINLHISLGFIK